MTDEWPYPDELGTLEEDFASMGQGFHFCDDEPIPNIRLRIPIEARAESLSHPQDISKIVEK